MSTILTPVSFALHSVSHRFGTRKVLSGITVQASAGQVLAITGPNGSGKSTLLRIAAGLLAPTRGEATMQITGASLDRVARRRYIGFTGPDVVLYPLLTAREQLAMLAKLHGLPFDEHLGAALIARVGLDTRRNDRLGDYSSGMRARLKLACALIHDPPVLMLDEPTSTLDTDGVEMVRAIVHSARLSKLVLIATNNPAEAAWADAHVRLAIRGPRVSESSSVPGRGVIPGSTRFSGGAITILGQAGILAKDLLCELRAPSAVSAVLVFALASLTVIAFAVGPGQLSTVVSASLLWVELLFACVAGLSHVFTREEETGTALLLRLHAHPNAVFISKLAYNLLLLSVVALVVAPLYAAMLHLQPERPVLFACSVVAGLPALAAVSTATAGLVARAGGKGALFGAISLPLLLPLMFIAIDCTLATITAVPTPGSFRRDCVGLIAYAVMLITAALMIFPLVWDD